MSNRSFKRNAMKFEKYSTKVVVHGNANDPDVDGNATMVVHFYYLDKEFDSWVFVRSYPKIASFDDDDEESIETLMNLVCDCIFEDGVDFEKFLSNVVYPSDKRHSKMKTDKYIKSQDWKSHYDRLLTDNELLVNQLLQNVGQEFDETGLDQGLSIHSFNLNKNDSDLVIEFINHIASERKRRNANNEAIKELIKNME